MCIRGHIVSAGYVSGVIERLLRMHQGEQCIGSICIEDEDPASMEELEFVSGEEQLEDELTSYVDEPDFVDYEENAEHPIEEPDEEQTDENN